jgi:two-component system nitrate/nitrite response regulator NarL
MGEIINVLVTAKNNENKKSILAATSEHNDLQIIGIENDETGAVIKSEQLKPDVLIMDLQPPGLDGVELAPIIHRRSPETAIVMICDRDENEYANLALQAGISGYLLRNADMEKLYYIVKIANLGGYYFNSSIINKTFKTISLINQFPGQFIEIQNKLKNKNICFSFSPVERLIITKMALGYPDKKIAKYFNYSEGTITNIINTIRRKTKVKSRMQIVTFSLFYGLINMDIMDIF